MHKWAQLAGSLLVFTLIPWVVLGGGFFLLLRAQARRPERFASVTARSLIGSALLTVALNVWTIVAILTSTSSTAAVGFVFLPMYSFAAATLGFAASWSLLTLIEAARGRARGRLAAIGAAVFLAIVASAGAYAWRRSAWLSDAASAQTPPARITAIAEQAFAGNDLETLERLASNPALDAGLAEKLTAHCQGELEGARPGLCYSVFVGLAASPAATPELLASLAKFSDVTIRSRVAQNPHTPAAIAEALANDPDASVRMWVAMHPGLSRETLERLAKDADPSVRSYANAVLQRSVR